MRKPTVEFPNRSDTNQAVQAQIWLEAGNFEELYYSITKPKALISFAVTAKLICALVFPYANCWLSHYAPHIIYSLQQKMLIKN